MRGWRLLLSITLLPALARAAEPTPDAPLLDCLIEPFQTIELGTAVPGVVQEVLVKRADTVTTGQALVRLESSVEESALRQARERAEMLGTVKARQADLRLARRNMERMARLFERHIIPAQKRDEARAQYEIARRNYQVALENRRLAQLEARTYQARLGRRIVRSPIDGVVVERQAMAGEFVDERPLLTLAQLDPLRVEVLMPAHRFGSVHPGMRAEVKPEIDLPEPLVAKVVTVDRVIDPASGTFRVSLELPNPEQRIPGGLKCSARFLPEPAVATTPAPSSASDDMKPAETTPDHDTGQAVAQANPIPPAPDVTPAEDTTVPDTAPLTTAHNDAPPADDPDPAVQAPSATAQADTASPATGDAPWCAILEATDDSGLGALRKRLTQAGIQARTQATGRAVRDHVVETTIPRGQCRARLRRIREAGFSDIACYRSKKTGRTVLTAGVFRHLRFARKRQQELAAKGFEMSIRTRYRHTKGARLALRAASAEQAAEVLAGLPEPLRRQVRPRPCGSDGAVLAQRHND